MILQIDVQRICKIEVLDYRQKFKLFFVCLYAKSIFRKYSFTLQLLLIVQNVMHIEFMHHFLYSNKNLKSNL
jgi:hypothetical protein